MAGLGDTRSKPVGTPFCRCPCPPAVPVPGPPGPVATRGPPEPGGSSPQHPQVGGQGCPTGSPGAPSHWYPNPGDRWQRWQLPGTRYLHDTPASLPKTCPSCPGQRFAGWVTAETPQSRGAEVPGDPPLPPNPSPAAAPGGTGPVPRSGARDTGTHCAPHWDGGTHWHGAGTGTGTTRSSEEAPDALPSTLSRGIR